MIYRGLLSIGWQNYWAFKLENWWNANFENVELRTTSAKDRVAILNKKLNLQLVAAEKIKFCSSDEFWTVCFGLNRPLDPANGFVISDSKKNPWLEEEYVSGLAELEKTNSDSWRINVIDRERYLYFKNQIAKVK